MRRVDFQNVSFSQWNDPFASSLRPYQQAGPYQNTPWAPWGAPKPDTTRPVYRRLIQPVPPPVKPEEPSSEEEEAANEDPVAVPSGTSNEAPEGESQASLGGDVIPEGSAPPPPPPAPAEPALPVEVPIPPPPPPPLEASLAPPPLSDVVPPPFDFQFGADKASKKKKDKSGKASKSSAKAKEKEKKAKREAALKAKREAAKKDKQAEKPKDSGDNERPLEKPIVAKERPTGWARIHTTKPKPKAKPAKDLKSPDKPKEPKVVKSVLKHDKSKEATKKDEATGESESSEPKPASPEPAGDAPPPSPEGKAGEENRNPSDLLADPAPTQEEQSTPPAPSSDLLPNNSSPPPAPPSPHSSGPSPLPLNFKFGSSSQEEDAPPTHDDPTTQAEEIPPRKSVNESSPCLADDKTPDVAQCEPPASEAPISPAPTPAEESGNPIDTAAGPAPDSPAPSEKNVHFPPDMRDPKPSKIVAKQKAAAKIKKEEKEKKEKHKKDKEAREAKEKEAKEKSKAKEVVQIRHKSRKHDEERPEDGHSKHRKKDRPDDEKVEEGPRRLRKKDKPEEERSEDGHRKHRRKDKRDDERSEESHGKHRRRDKEKYESRERLREEEDDDRGSSKERRRRRRKHRDKGGDTGYERERDRSPEKADSERSVVDDKPSNIQVMEATADGKLTETSADEIATSDEAGGASPPLNGFPPIPSTDMPIETPTGVPTATSSLPLKASPELITTDNLTDSVPQDTSNHQPNTPPQEATSPDTVQSSLEESRNSELDSLSASKGGLPSVDAPAVEENELPLDHSGEQELTENAASDSTPGDSQSPNAPPAESIDCGSKDAECLPEELSSLHPEEPSIENDAVPTSEGLLGMAVAKEVGDPPGIEQVSAETCSPEATDLDPKSSPCENLQKVLKETTPKPATEGALENTNKSSPDAAPESQPDQDLVHALPSSTDTKPEQNSSDNDQQSLSVDIDSQSMTGIANKLATESKGIEPSTQERQNDVQVKPIQDVEQKESFWKRVFSLGQKKKVEEPQSAPKATTDSTKTKEDVAKEFSPEAESNSDGISGPVSQAHVQPGPSPDVSDCQPKQDSVKPDQPSKQLPEEVAPTKTPEDTGPKEDGSIPTKSLEPLVNVEDNTLGADSTAITKHVETDATEPIAVPYTDNVTSSNNQIPQGAYELTLGKDVQSSDENTPSRPQIHKVSGLASEENQSLDEVVPSEAHIEPEVEKISKEIAPFEPEVESQEEEGSQNPVIEENESCQVQIGSKEEEISRGPILEETGPSGEATESEEVSFEFVSEASTSFGRHTESKEEEVSQENSGHPELSVQELESRGQKISGEAISAPESLIKSENLNQGISGTVTPGKITPELPVQSVSPPERDESNETPGCCGSEQQESSLKDSGETILETQEPTSSAAEDPKISECVGAGGGSLYQDKLSTEVETIPLEGERDTIPPQSRDSVEAGESLSDQKEILSTNDPDPDDSGSPTSLGDSEVPSAEANIDNLAPSQVSGHQAALGAPEPLLDDIETTGNDIDDTEISAAASGKLPQPNTAENLSLSRETSGDSVSNEASIPDPISAKAAGQPSPSSEVHSDPISSVQIFQDEPPSSSDHVLNDCPPNETDNNATSIKDFIQPESTIESTEGPQSISEENTSFAGPEYTSAQESVDQGSDRTDESEVPKALATQVDSIKANQEEAGATEHSQSQPVQGVQGESEMIDTEEPSPQELSAPDSFDEEECSLSKPLPGTNNQAVTGEESCEPAVEDSAQAKNIEQAINEGKVSAQSTTFSAPSLPQNAPPAESSSINQADLPNEDFTETASDSKAIPPTEDITLEEGTSDAVALEEESTSFRESPHANVSPVEHAAPLEKSPYKGDILRSEDSTPPGDLRNEETPLGEDVILLEECSRNEKNSLAEDATLEGSHSEVPPAEEAIHERGSRNEETLAGVPLESAKVEEISVEAVSSHEETLRNEEIPLVEEATLKAVSQSEEISVEDVTSLKTPYDGEIPPAKDTTLPEEDSHYTEIAKDVTPLEGLDDETSLAKDATPLEEGSGNEEIESAEDTGSIEESSHKEIPLVEDSLREGGLHNELIPLVEDFAPEESLRNKEIPLTKDSILEEGLDDEEIPLVEDAVRKEISHEGIPLPKVSLEESSGNEIPPVEDSTIEEIPLAEDATFRQGSYNEEIPLAEEVALENSLRNEEIQPSKDPILEGGSHNEDIPLAEDTVHEESSHNEEIPLAEDDAPEESLRNEIPPAEDSALEEGSHNERIPPAEDVAVEEGSSNEDITLTEDLALESVRNEIPPAKDAAAGEGSSNEDIPLTEDLALEESLRNEEVPLTEDTMHEESSHSEEIPPTEGVALEERLPNEIPPAEVATLGEDSPNEEIPPTEEVALEERLSNDIPPAEDVTLGGGSLDEEIPLPRDVALEESPRSEIPPAEDFTLGEDSPNEEIPPTEEVALEERLPNEIPPAEVATLGEDSPNEEIPPTEEVALEERLPNEIPPAEDVTLEGGSLDDETPLPGDVALEESPRNEIHSAEDVTLGEDSPNEEIPPTEEVALKERLPNEIPLPGDVSLEESPRNEIPQPEDSVLEEGPYSERIHLAEDGTLGGSHNEEIPLTEDITVEESPRSEIPLTEDATLEGEDGTLGGGSRNEEIPLTEDATLEASPHSEIPPTEDTTLGEGSHNERTPSAEDASPPGESPHNGDSPLAEDVATLGTLSIEEIRSIEEAPYKEALITEESPAHECAPLIGDSSPENACSGEADGCVHSSEGSGIVTMALSDSIAAGVGLPQHNPSNASHFPQSNSADGGLSPGQPGPDGAPEALSSEKPPTGPQTTDLAPEAPVPQQDSESADSKEDLIDHPDVTADSGDGARNDSPPVRGPSLDPIVPPSTLQESVASPTDLVEQDSADTVSPIEDANIGGSLPQDDPSTEPASTHPQESETEETKSEGEAADSASESSSKETDLTEPIPTPTSDPSPEEIDKTPPPPPPPPSSVPEPQELGSDDPIQEPEGPNIMGSVPSAPAPDSTQASDDAFQHPPRIPPPFNFEFCDSDVEKNIPLVTPDATPNDSGEETCSEEFVNITKPPDEMNLVVQVEDVEVPTFVPLEKSIEMRPGDDTPSSQEPTEVDLDEMKAESKSCIPDASVEAPQIDDPMSIQDVPRDGESSDDTPLLSGTGPPPLDFTFNGSPSADTDMPARDGETCNDQEGEKPSDSQPEPPEDGNEESTSQAKENGVEDTAGAGGSIKNNSSSDPPSDPTHEPKGVGRNGDSPEDLKPSDPTPLPVQDKPSHPPAAEDPGDLSAPHAGGAPKSASQDPPNGEPAPAPPKTPSIPSIPEEAISSAPASPANEKRSSRRHSRSGEHAHYSRSTRKRRESEVSAGGHSSRARHGSQGSREEKREKMREGAKDKDRSKDKGKERAVEVVREEAASEVRDKEKERRRSSRAATEDEEKRRRRKKREEEERQTIAEEEARATEEEARRKRHEARREARKQRAEEEAKAKAEEEARQKAAEEEARLHADEERKKRHEARRKRIEEEAKVKAEEDARLKAEEEERRKRHEARREARRKAEEERTRLQAEEDEARRERRRQREREREGERGGDIDEDRDSYRRAVESEVAETPAISRKPERRSSVRELPESSAAKPDSKRKLISGLIFGRSNSMPLSKEKERDRDRDRERERERVKKSNTMPIEHERPRTRSGEKDKERSRQGSKTSLTETERRHRHSARAPEEEAEYRARREERRRQREAAAATASAIPEEEVAQIERPIINGKDKSAPGMSSVISTRRHREERERERERPRSSRTDSGDKLRLERIESGERPRSNRRESQKPSNTSKPGKKGFLGGLMKAFV